MNGYQIKIDPSARAYILLYYMKAVVEGSMLFDVFLVSVKKNFSFEGDDGGCDGLIAYSCRVNIG
ncbi:hypothetical protein [Bartonella sp. MM73XJBT]|uniref:hypothetical protein n=1 Tax=Bartonella sp. MM73XJBT TaxID=3019095 RepID=UPI0023606DD4|nr:hypothetical protein [Bartonella sp. MM73XJBT]